MASNTKRFRLSVPEEDETVKEWLENQVNYSVSIRLLIRQDIAKHGFSDVMCREIMPRKKTETDEAEQELPKRKYVRRKPVEKQVVQEPVSEPVQEVKPVQRNPIPAEPAVSAPPPAVKKPVPTGDVEEMSDLLESILG